MVLRAHKQPGLQGPVSRKEGQGSHINLLEVECIWIACQQIRKEITGKVVSFQIDNTAAVSYLWKKDGTHCRELIDLARKILFSCQKEGVSVCLEYQEEMVSLRANSMSRGKRAQEGA